MEQIIEIVKLYIDDTPGSLRVMVASSIALFMSAYFLDKTVSILNRQSFRAIYRGLFSIGSKTVSSLERDIGESFVSPIYRPKLSLCIAILKFIFDIFGFVAFSFMALLFLWLTIEIPSPETPDGFNPYIMLWPATFFYFIARFAFVEMDRSCLLVRHKLGEIRGA